jgi:hypothetical protein
MNERGGKTKNSSLTTGLKETTCKRKVLKLVLKKQDMNVWTGLIRLRNGPGSELF